MRPQIEDPQRHSAASLEANVNIRIDNDPLLSSASGNTAVEDLDNDFCHPKKPTKFSWKSSPIIATKRFSSSFLFPKGASNRSTGPSPTSPHFEPQSIQLNNYANSNTTSNSSLSNEDAKISSKARSFYNLKKTTKIIFHVNSSPSFSVQEAPNYSESLDPSLSKGANEIFTENTGADNTNTDHEHKEQPQYIEYTNPTETQDADAPLVFPQTPSVQIQEPTKTASKIPINRQRSRTLNSLENPLNDIAGNNSGILASIANLVKLNKSATMLRKASINSCTTPTLSQKDALFVMSDETPSLYLDRLLSNYPLTYIISTLSLKESTFYRETMQLYLEKYFNFYQMPLDMALRSFLMINELPKETQQIDRVVLEFAKHYLKEQRRTLVDEDTVYILTFSLIMVHTDRFNPNNKKKISRYDFIQNVTDALQSNSSHFEKDIIGYLYDNICHTPFIKIIPEQSNLCLEALKNGTNLPYPIASFLNTDPQQPIQQSIAQQLQVSPAPAEVQSIISRSSSMQQLSIPTNATLRSRRSSTSFLWNSPLPLDPYQYIVDRNVEALKVSNLNFYYSNPYLNTKIMILPKDNEEITAELIEDSLNEYIDEELTTPQLTKILNTMIKSRCELILKVTKSKSSFLTANKYAKLIPLNEPQDNTKNEYCVARVLKVGMIMKQESKLLTNTRTWKKYFCILTSLGLFLFKSVALFKMTYAGTLKNTKTVVIEETASISLLDTFQPAYSFSKGAYASRKVKNIELDQLVNSSNNALFNNSSNPLDNPNLRNYTFFIYASNINSVVMVSNVYELRSWISNINIVSSLNGVKLPQEKLDIGIFSIKKDAQHNNDLYYEIAPQGEITLEEKLKKKCESIDFDYESFRPNDGCHEAMLTQIRTMKIMSCLTPLQTKTKEMIQASGKIMMIKMEWTWYEKCRTRALIDLLKRVKAIIDLYLSALHTNSQLSSEDEEDGDDFYSCLELSL